MKVDLAVNGKEVSADVEDHMLLVHFLRDVANLTAMSLGQPGASRTASWTADVPLVLSLRLNSAALHPWERPSGLVRATYLSGAPAKGVHVALSQASGHRSATPFSLFHSTAFEAMPPTGPAAAR